MRAERSNPVRQTGSWIASSHFPQVQLASSPVENDAGDDEHRRHRQHLRKRFRGRPFAGFLHVYLPKLGHDSTLRQKRERRSRDLLGTPHDEYSLNESPLGEYRLCQGRTAMRRHFDSSVAFSSEVATGSREENASKQQSRVRSDQNLALDCCSRVSRRIGFELISAAKTNNKFWKTKVNHGPY
jgi:hypothetical protein